jgi:hypothetical protein
MQNLILPSPTMLKKNSISAMGSNQVKISHLDCSNGMSNSNVDMRLTNTPDFEIHQDHDTDLNYLDTSRSNSSKSFDSLAEYVEMISAVQAEIQTSPPVLRNPFQHSTKGLSSACSLFQRNSTVVKASRSSFYEIIVHAYGNGLNAMNEDMSSVA